MNPPADIPKAADVPLPNFNLLLHALQHPLRWKILKELSAGEGLLTSELVTRVGGYTDLVSKHLAVLRRAGLTRMHGRVHSITKA